MTDPIMIVLYLLLGGFVGLPHAIAWWRFRKLTEYRSQLETFLTNGEMLVEFETYQQMMKFYQLLDVVIEQTSWLDLLNFFSVSERLEGYQRLLSRARWWAGRIAEISRANDNLREDMEQIVRDFAPSNN